MRKVAALLIVLLLLADPALAQLRQNEPSVFQPDPEFDLRKKPEPKAERLGHLVFRLQSEGVIDDPKSVPKGFFKSALDKAEEIERKYPRQTKALYEIMKEVVLRRLHTHKKFKDRAPIDE